MDLVNLRYSLHLAFLALVKVFAGNRLADSHVVELAMLCPKARPSPQGIFIQGWLLSPEDFKSIDELSHSQIPGSPPMLFLNPWR
ncbi:MAG: hypothetical protein ACYDHG_06920 [Desulfomonilaceae bacterium]